MRLIHVFIYLVIFLFSISFSAAQNYSWQDIEIGTKGEEFSLGTTCGLTAPQFSEMDIDLDGVNDIIIFDRDGNVLIPLLYKNKTYSYAPGYREFFPPIKNWMRAVDINNDGFDDIVCYNLESPLNGVEVYLGEELDGHIHFNKIKFTEGPYEVLHFNYNNQVLNMDIISSDLPDVVDVDSDGDFDIITFNPNDGFVYFFKNTNIENGKSLDYPEYVLEDACWGKFYESGFNETIYLSENSDECYSNLVSEDKPKDKKILHAGSTTTLFDQNNDGDYEILIGDLTSEHIVYLENGGTKENAYMNLAVTNFPDYTDKVEMPIFLSPFVFDVDRDGLKDFVVSPNSKGGVENLKNVLYYRNKGPKDNVKFEFIQDDLFVGDMFDTGSFAAPTFCDFNQDGLIDLLIGTYGRYNPSANPLSRLILYKNIGTIDIPKFELEDDNYLGLLEYTSQYYLYSPAIGDLDSDGDDDLLVGTNNGRIIYFENQAGKDQPYDFKTPIFDYLSIDVGDNVTPALADLNRDGLTDIILGEKNQNKDPNTGAIGNLNYFQNIGTVGAPMFNTDEKVLPNDNTLGEVLVKHPLGSSGTATPFFYDTGEKYLLWVGTEHGDVFLFDDVDNNQNASFTEISNKVGKLYEGYRSNIAVADINNDKVLDMVIGVSRGGVAFYSTNLDTKGMVDSKEIEQSVGVILYPNPSNGELYIESDRKWQEFIVYNTLGQVVQSGKILNARFSLGTLSSGHYYVTLKDHLGNQSTQPIYMNSKR